MAAFGIVEEKVRKRGEEEGAEAALAAIGAIEIAALENAGEELLGEVLSGFDGVAAAANVGIEGIPILGAEDGESVVVLAAVRVAGGHDEGPGGSWKPPWRRHIP